MRVVNSVQSRTATNLRTLASLQQYSIQSLHKPLCKSLTYCICGSHSHSSRYLCSIHPRHSSSAQTSAGFGALEQKPRVGLVQQALVEEVKPSTMGLGTLFLTSFLPCLKVALLCGVGAFAAAKGMLTLEGRRTISTLIFQVFVPCQFLYLIGSGVGFADAIKLWPIAFNTLASYAIGGVLGAVLVAITKPSKDFRKQLIVATMVGNIGNLPLVLIDSLGTDPKLAALGGSAVGEQYIMISNFSAAFYQFPLIIMLLSKPKNQQQEHTQIPLVEATPDQAEQKLLGQTTESSQGHDRPISAAEPSPPPPPQLSGMQLTQPLDSAREFPSKGNPSGDPEQKQQGMKHSASYHDSVASEDHNDASQDMHLLHNHNKQLQGNSDTFAIEISSNTSAENVQKPSWRQGLPKRWQSWQPMIQGIFSPPTIACIIALTIASITPVRAALFTPSGPLRLVGETFKMFNDMAIPSLMLVLGANLQKGPGVAKISWRLIIGVILCRLVVLPLIGTGLVMSMRSMGLLNNIQPIGIIAMLLTHATPTAIIVHSMATMFQNREDDVAALLFWEYAATAALLPFVLAFFLRVSL